MTQPLRLNACASCVHRLRSRPGLITCEAYPHGVPVNIANGDLDHTQMVEGDSGILYELDPFKEILLEQYLNWKALRDGRNNSSTG